MGQRPSDPSTIATAPPPHESVIGLPALHSRLFQAPVSNCKPSFFLCAYNRDLWGILGAGPVPTPDVRQRKGESLRQFIQHFCQVHNTIPCISPAIIIMAFGG